MKAAVVMLLLGVVFVSGCTAPEMSREEVRARTACVLLCKTAVQNGLDLSSGPCLDEELIDDWVCDVAHNPRLPVDDLPENQCPLFGSVASHFVEVDEYCDVIRVY